MSSVVESFRARPHAVVLAVIAVGVAGCSESARFIDYPVGSRPAAEMTASAAPQAAPSGRIEQSSLAPPSAGRPDLPATGTVGTGAGMGSYQPTSYQPANYSPANYSPANYSPVSYPPAAVAPPMPPASAAPADVTGAVQAQRQQAGQWSWDGGTAVTVAPGETIEAVARRHGVPASAIMQANGLTSAAIRPGQRLVIPRYNATMNNATARAPAANAVAATPARPQATGTSGVHVVAPGETLFKLSRTYGKPVADIARANNLPAHATLKIGDRMVIPGARTPSGTRTTTRPAEGKPLAKQSPKPAPVVQPAETQQASVVTPTNDLPAPAAAAKTAEGPPSFRWPVKGRVIAAFGPKPNGQQNDGINVSVPEGTPIKAAEDGVVAYAGNELKGYGNLVLIRHANGYVTAYAHAKELQVKRGDQIKRGQVIGKAGQTGNVDAPQLHFEVRKGPTPLDPMPMLSGG